MDAETAQTVATLVSAGGGGAVLLALVTGLVKWLSGAAGRERARNTSIQAQRVDAVEEAREANARADSSDSLRRDEQEYTAILRRQLIENGIQPSPRPEKKEAS